MTRPFLQSRKGWNNARGWNSDLGSGAFSDIVLNKTLLVAVIKQPELADRELL